MPIFLIQDERTSTELIPTDYSVMIRQSDNMIEVLNSLNNELQLRTFGQAFGSELHIVCHGFPNGLQLGNGFIHHDNVSIFSAIRGRVGSILVHGCSAALFYPQGCNGSLMCSRMAISTRAEVTAADSTQGILTASSASNDRGVTYLQPYRGRVGTWNVQGVLSSRPAFRGYL
jgi:hypothetical protein